VHGVEIAGRHQRWGPTNAVRSAFFDTGHVPPNDLLMKKILDWFDRYSGSVH
jgi:hypothetical protein